MTTERCGSTCLKSDSFFCKRENMHRKNITNFQLVASLGYACTKVSLFLLLHPILDGRKRKRFAHGLVFSDSISFLFFLGDAPPLCSSILFSALFHCLSCAMEHHTPNSSLSLLHSFLETLFPLRRSILSRFCLAPLLLQV